ncbi:MAG: CDP-alcohol phosphatidyltransferase family protein [Beijerinckiaceae bacterium]|nr:CDP-alcohol phosphatidyltransferase family protein [Beijerinckiaceae bacterium]
MNPHPLLASLPNLISLGRLVLVPIIVSLIIQPEWGLAFLLFVVAGVSDAVDGWLAKRFNLRTELGAYLDPIADKALLVSIYVSLAVIGVLPATIVVLVVSRDVMIVGAVMVSWLLDKPVAIRPLLVSKLNTLAQISFAAAVLAAKAFDFPLGMWFTISLYVVAALTLASAAAYLTQWVRHMDL